MSYTRFFQIIFILHLIAFSSAAAAESRYSAEAEEIRSNASSSEILANGAAQVSQLHSQAHSRILVLLTKQGDGLLDLSKQSLELLGTNRQLLEKLAKQGEDLNKTLLQALYLCTGLICVCLIAVAAVLRRSHSA